MAGLPAGLRQWVQLQLARLMAQRQLPEAAELARAALGQRHGAALDALARAAPDGADAHVPGGALETQGNRVVRRRGDLLLGLAARGRGLAVQIELPRAVAAELELVNLVGPSVAHVQGPGTRLDALDDDGVG